MRESKKDIGICIPKINRLIIRWIMRRYVKSGLQGESQRYASDTVRVTSSGLIFTLLFLVAILFTIPFVGGFRIYLALTFFGIMAFFAAYFYLFEIVDFIILDNRTIMHHSSFKLQTIYTYKIKEALTHYRAPEENEIGYGGSRRKLVLTLIEKDNYKKHEFLARIDLQEEKDCMNKATRYFKDHHIPFNEPSPQYYLELIDRMKLSKQEIESATQMIDEELVDMRSSDHVLKVKGLWHHKLDDHAEALEWLERYVQLHQDDKEVLVAIVGSLGAVENYSRAVQFTAAMVPRFPDDGKIMALHGKMLYLSGRKDEGLHYLQSEIDRLTAIAATKRGMLKKLKYYEIGGHLSLMKKELIGEDQEF